MKTSVIILLVLALFLMPLCVHAKPGVKNNKGDTKIDLFSSFTGSEGSKNLVGVVMMLTILAFAPAILLLMSSFTRIIVVLSFLRQAIGIPQLPPNQIIIGLSLFLTFFIMAPTYERINANALAPYMDNKIGYGEFINKSSQEMSIFMLRYTKEKDIALFMNIAGLQRPKGEGEIPIRVLVPAFAITELKRAFQIGFLLYIPFLVIDLVVASVLLSAGMMMLPPIFISLPFKLMLFVLVDGWSLLVGSIIKGFF
jgi:flagellar biosynthesis protein FliP